MNLRRFSVALSTGLTGAVAVATTLAVTIAPAQAAAPTPVATTSASPTIPPVVPSVTATAGALEVPSGASTVVTATVTGATETDVIAVGIRTDDGWVEVGREPAGTDTVHTFTVTPPSLGPSVYRVGLLSDGKLVSYSGAVRVIGVIAVNPNPVVKGETVTLSGVLPTAVARPVGLQVQTATGGWRLIDSDFSAADGSVSFVEVAPRSARVRFVVPARTIGGVDYLAQASTPVDVTVIDAPLSAAG